ncbi:virulence protein [Scatolibacter rhodanostii]|uniref:virulence protein n=1 Tax=Scatolibacter rhodanostii TaxID=2014781 RepID=UPI000C06CF19|nr:virulence protein [Scatolibacter rhodanostii]
MQEYKFNVMGAERKRLVGAISEILNQPIKYLGMPSAAYEVGQIHIDKQGTLTGEVTAKLLEQLEKQGFIPESVPIPDSITIEIPLDGFTENSLENLRKMVKSKENLLMTALGVEELPILLLEDRVQFPWCMFTEDSERVHAYAQLVTALCNTAKEKKRVNAKQQDGVDNEKFTMRVWLISLGCTGVEYKYLRKIMGENLSGNSAFRYGKPQKEHPDTTENEVQGDE